jgi:hypothetical protein
MSIRPEIGRGVDFEWPWTMIYLLKLAKHFALSFSTQNFVHQRRAALARPWR